MPIPLFLLFLLRFLLLFLLLLRFIFSYHNLINGLPVGARVLQQAAEHSHGPHNFLRHLTELPRQRLRQHLRGWRERMGKAKKAVSSSASDEWPRVTT